VAEPVDQATYARVGVWDIQDKAEVYRPLATNEAACDAALQTMPEHLLDRYTRAVDTALLFESLAHV
jgi:hypothetical protein